MNFASVPDCRFIPISLGYDRYRMSGFGKILCECIDPK